MYYILDCSPNVIIIIMITISCNLNEATPTAVRGCVMVITCYTLLFEI